MSNIDIKVNAKTALILGSGWNKLVDKVRIIKLWDYNEIFSVKSTVANVIELTYGH